MNRSRFDEILNNNPLNKIREESKEYKENTIIFPKIKQSFNRNSKYYIVY